MFNCGEGCVGVPLPLSCKVGSIEMTRDEAVSRIQATLGFRSDMQAQAEATLREAQEVLEAGVPLPWFLRSELTPLTTAPNVSTIAKPIDFLREWDDDGLYIEANDGTLTSLHKDLLSHLRRRLPGVGRPLAYAFDGFHFHLFPIPDAVYNLKLTYFAQDAALHVNIENEWLRHLPYLLIGMAGQTLAAAARDAQARAQFQTWEAEGRRALNFGSAALDAANMRYVMGGAV